MSTAPVHPWLYDPAGVGALVRSRRPVTPPSAVGDVGSGVGWSAVVRLSPWSDTALAGSPAVVDGAAWGAAAGAADLVRLPGEGARRAAWWIQAFPAGRRVGVGA